MKEYFIYRIYNPEPDVFKMTVFETPQQKEINLKLPLQVKEDKQINLEEVRRQGLIPEWLYFTCDTGMDNYLAATKTKNWYYLNVLKDTETSIKGKIPTFWTNLKYIAYMSLYLIIVFGGGIFLCNLILNSLGIAPY